MREPDDWPSAVRAAFEEGYQEGRARSDADARAAYLRGFAEARDAAARLAETPSGPLLPLYIRIRQLQPKETE